MFQNISYFLENGSCTFCDVPNCADCLTLEICQVCDEDNNYFLVNGSCIVCEIQNCVDCFSLQYCQKCDEDNDYFLQDGECALCSIPDCVDCASLQICEVYDNTLAIVLGVTIPVSLIIVGIITYLVKKYRVRAVQMDETNAEERMKAAAGTF